jgi:hypothetical protein
MEEMKATGATREHVKESAVKPVLPHGTRALSMPFPRSDRRRRRFLSDKNFVHFCNVIITHVTLLYAPLCCDV